MTPRAREIVTYMLELHDLLAKDAVVLHQSAPNKRALLQILATNAAKTYGMDADAIFESAWQREALGSTGVGEGVAVPHARLDNIDRPCALLAVLDTPVDFDAPDGRPCDLVFLLISPSDAGADHLKALAKISRTLRNADVRAALRNAVDAAGARLALEGLANSASAAA